MNWKNAWMYIWIVAIGTGIGYLGTTINRVETDLRFKVGSKVELSIGGRGQITKISGDQYRVRVWTTRGIRSHWFHEWEFEPPFFQYEVGQVIKLKTGVQVEIIALGRHDQYLVRSGRSTGPREFWVDYQEIMQ